MEFKQEIEFAIADQMEYIDLVFRSSCIDLFNRVVVSTPVDSGLARNNWLVSSGDNSGETRATESKAGTDSRNAIIEHTYTLGGKALLFNNLPYIERLEDGYSAQAPVGMVKFNAPLWPSIVQERKRYYEQR